MDRAIHEEHLGLEPGGGHACRLSITCKRSTVIVDGSAVNICILAFVLQNLLLVNVLCVHATCVVVARAPTCSLRKKGGTTLDIRDVAASYSSIIRYSCSTPLLG